MLKKMYLFFCSGLICACVSLNVYAEGFEDEVIFEESVQARTPDEISADALDAYDVEGSVFEKITNLEQEKMLMKLEAERMKLEMELDTLNAQKLKKQLELDGMYGQADQRQEIERTNQEFQKAKAELDSQIESLKKQIAEIDNDRSTQQIKIVETIEKKPEPPTEPQIVGKYKLINVIGVGNQLQATIQDVSTGQNRRSAVGKQLNGYTIKSISLNDGIVFEKDGVSESLNVGK